MPRPLEHSECTFPYSEILSVLGGEDAYVGLLCVIVTDSVEKYGFSQTNHVQATFKENADIRFSVRRSTR